MIKKDTIEYRLVSLIGLAGEIKTDELYKLNYGKEYIRKTISRLNSNGFIKVYKYLDRKYLRLTPKCKKYLSSNCPERFSDCFEGATSTNKIRNDDYRRERYHRLGEVLVMLNLADIKIFPDEKTLMKNTHGFTRADSADLSDYCVEKNTAEFYSSAELKSAGLFMNARTSRALGIIYSHPEVYIIYNVADGVFKWENKVEESFFFRAGQTFLGDLNRNRNSYAKMIFVGKNMWTFENLLATKSSTNLNAETTMRIINGGDNIYRKIEIANLSKLKRDNINTTMSTLRCDQANVLKKLQIIEQTDKMFDGENLSKQCTLYDLLYLYNICNGEPSKSISQVYKSRMATQKDVLSRFINLLGISTNYTSLVRSAEEAKLISTDDFFLFDDANATYYNLLSVVYNSVFYDPTPNNETNELPIFENLLESGRLYGIGVSGIRELKNEAILDVYLFKEKVCPAQEVEGADGRFFKFINYYGEMLYRPYFTQQQWSNDGNSFVCSTYDSTLRIYRMYAYNIQTETIKYVDSGSSNYVVVNDDYIYFIKKVDGISSLWKNNMLNDEPSELIYTFAPGVEPSMPHISSDGRYVSFECSDSERKNFPRPANTTALVRLDLQTLEFKYTYYSYNYSNIINHIQVNPVYPELLYFGHEADTASGFLYTDIQDRASIMNLNTNEVTHIQQGLIENSNSNMILFTHEYWSANGEYLYITNLLGQTQTTSPNGIVRVNKDGTHRKYYYNDLIKPKYEGGLGLRSNHSSVSGDNEYFAIDCEWVYILRADTNQVFPICDTSFYTKGHPYHPHPVIAKNRYIVNWGMILEDGILGISWYDFTDLDKHATGGRYKINDYVENVRYKENRNDYPELNCDSSTAIMGNKECLFAENGKNIYLDVNENIVDSIDEAVTITFEYYDNSFEPIVVTYTKGVKNDNDLCNFENIQREIERTGENTWKTAQISIESGNFENIGTFDSDFYITGKNSDVYIANIKVDKNQYDSVCINVDTLKNDASYNFRI